MWPYWGTEWLLSYMYMHMYSSTCTVVHVQYMYMYIHVYCTMCIPLLNIEFTKIRNYIFNFILLLIVHIYIRVGNNSAPVLIWAPKLAKGAPDFDITMHASCTVVSTGDGNAHQML